MKDFKRNRVALAASIGTTLAGLSAQAATPVPALPAAADVYAPALAMAPLPFGGELLAGGVLLLFALCAIALAILMLRDRFGAGSARQPLARRKRPSLPAHSQAPRRTRRPVSVTRPTAHS
jgi:hypothetical protein